MTQSNAVLEKGPSARGRDDTVVVRLRRPAAELHSIDPSSDRRVAVLDGHRGIVLAEVEHLDAAHMEVSVRDPAALPERTLARIAHRGRFQGMITLVVRNDGVPPEGPRTRVRLTYEGMHSEAGMGCLVEFMIHELGLPAEAVRGVIPRRDERWSFFEVGPGMPGASLPAGRHEEATVPDLAAVWPPAGSDTIDDLDLHLGSPTEVDFEVGFTLLDGEDDD